MQKMQITQTTQAAVLTPVTVQTTLEKTQVPTGAQTLLKTADNSVEPLPEYTRPRKDGPGGN